MTPERWREVQKMFAEALEQKPAERTTYLNKVCTDASLRQQVELMIAAHEQGDSSFLEPPVVGNDEVLKSGTKLGSYEILACLGKGGMGEVYRARDTRLNRIVAIKILAHRLADRSELRERFEREARTIASLNHPHICTLHDIGQQDGIDYLVMECLEGETLASRLAKGRLSLEQTLQYAIQIADALDKAHRKGVTHRDLKPGNIMLTQSGAKLLDFGLAKLKQEVSPETATISQIQSANQPITAQGAIVGTLLYMAPEQLEGKETDARTDIFAFGTVVYEMATGKKAFEGKSQASIIAKILESEPPPISSLQPMTPPALDHAVKKCVAKEPADRWQSASDLHDELKWIAEAGSQSAAPEATTVGRARLLRRWALVSSLACLIAATITGFAVWKLKPTLVPLRQTVTRFVISLLPGEELSRGAGAASPVALSPDGTQLVYSAIQGGSPQLYVRSLDSLQDKPIAGTEGASAPFFSPDGQWVGFFAEGKLKKVPVTGGSPVVLCEVGGGFGASWGNDDTIFFAPGSMSGLWRVSAKGGTPQPFTELDRQNGEISHRSPRVLPGGKAVLFTVWTGPGWDEQQIQLKIVATGERRLLVRGGETGSYMPTGHVVYERAGTLMAVPFDIARLEVAGSAPVSLAEGVKEGGEEAYYAVSYNGLLAYVPGSPAQFEQSLIWVDRDGKVEPLPAPPRNYSTLRISPDGQEVALGIDGAQSDVWLYNLARRTFTRLTFEGSSQIPIWTPDGKRVTYRATRAGTRNLFWRMADGSGAEERLTTGEGNQTAASWSPDGKALGYYVVQGDTTAAAMWVLEVGGDRKPRPILPNSFNEFGPRFSPDGRWLAYFSDESGRFEVYVLPYPGPGGRWQVSADGGAIPVWNRNGRELFYRSGDRMMAVDVTLQPSFSAGEPKMLFEGQYAGAYDVSPDGQRFLMLKPVEEAAPRQINVVLNWTEELKRLVPTAK